MHPSPDTPSREIDRRQAKRLPYSTLVHYRRQAQEGIGTVRNISADGMFVEAQDRFAPGDRIRISFRYRHGGAYTDMLGEIARIGPSGVGVRFIW
jgi:hypothetical protein